MRRINPKQFKQFGFRTLFALLAVGLLYFSFIYLPIKRQSDQENRAYLNQEFLSTIETLQNLEIELRHASGDNLSVYSELSAIIDSMQVAINNLHQEHKHISKEYPELVSDYEEMLRSGQALWLELYAFLDYTDTLLTYNPKDDLATTDTKVLNERRAKAIKELRSFVDGSKTYTANDTFQFIDGSKQTQASVDSFRLNDETNAAIKQVASCLENDKNLNGPYCLTETKAMRTAILKEFSNIFAHEDGKSFSAHASQLGQQLSKSLEG